jgi:hypothetical protein
MIAYLALCYLATGVCIVVGATICGDDMKRCLDGKKETNISLGVVLLWPIFVLFSTLKFIRR